MKIDKQNFWEVIKIDRDIFIKTIKEITKGLGLFSIALLVAAIIFFVLEKWIELSKF